MLDYTLPHSTSHQLITEMANSSREVLEITGGSRSDLQHHHAQRIHELMRYRSHTVNTD